MNCILDDLVDFVNTEPLILICTYLSKLTLVIIIFYGLVGCQKSYSIEGTPVSHGSERQSPILNMPLNFAIIQTHVLNILDKFSVFSSSIHFPSVVV